MNTSTLKSNIKNEDINAIQMIDIETTTEREIKSIAYNLAVTV